MSSESRLVPRRIPACTVWILLAGLFASAPATAQFVEPGTVVIHTILGEFAGDQHGWVSQDLGDLNGDGICDFIIGAPGVDGGGNNRGRLYVYSGATGAFLFTPITGTINNGRLGNAVGAVTDVNGDGVTDIVAGAPSNNAGRAFIYSGATGAQLRSFIGQASGDQFGSSCRGIGDINTDGIGDVVIGAPLHDTNGTSSGRAYVYSATSTPSLLCTLNGGDATDQFGGACDVVGDVNSDGVPDFIISAETFAIGAGAGTGRAYVYSGAACVTPPVAPPPLRTLSPTGLAGAFSQYFLDGEGDVNNDGTPDIYVADFNVNKAYIFSGANGSLIRTHTGDGNGGFGIGRITGDVDDDGWADMLLCAWLSDAGATQAGKAFVYSGRTGGLLQTFTHTIANAHFGFDANPLGDVNGDGKPDFLVTAADDVGFRGTSYVLAGNTPRFSRADIDLDGDVDSQDATSLAEVLLGMSINSTHIKRGDVDRDGKRDGHDVTAFVQAALTP